MTPMPAPSHILVAGLAGVAATTTLLAVTDLKRPAGGLYRVVGYGLSFAWLLGLVVITVASAGAARVSGSLGQSVAVYLVLVWLTTVATGVLVCVVMALNRRAQTEQWGVLVVALAGDIAIGWWVVGYLVGEYIAG